MISKKIVGIGMLSIVSFLTQQSCSHTNKLTIAGSISSAQGEMLYLEDLSSGNPIIIDSAKLSSDRFKFQVEGKNYPTFYHLRLGKESIPFVMDSVADLQLHATAPNIFTSYQIDKGEEYNKQIQQISRRRYNTDKQIDSVLSRLTAGQISQLEAERSVEMLRAQLKNDLSTLYIYKDPKSPAAFYALYQHKGEGSYFDITSIGDHRAFAAVATAYEDAYPNAPYTPILRNMALQALAYYRANRAMNQPDSIRQKQLPTIAYPDIELLDNHGKPQKLSSAVAQGPVLLSFTAYSGDWSPQLVERLRKLQQNNPSLRIYEVSYDQDNYYWKNATRTLPWTCVHDSKNQTVGLYNITELPSFYLVTSEDLRRLTTPEQAIR